MSKNNSICIFFLLITTCVGNWLYTFPDIRIHFLYLDLNRAFPISFRSSSGMCNLFVRAPGGHVFLRFEFKPTSQISSPLANWKRQEGGKKQRELQTLLNTVICCVDYTYLHLIWYYVSPPRKAHSLTTTNSQIQNSIGWLRTEVNFTRLH
jgi:hypothetical protein